MIRPTLLAFTFALFTIHCQLSVTPFDPDARSPDVLQPVDTIQPLDVVRRDIVGADTRDVPSVLDVSSTSCLPQDVLFGGYCLDCSPRSVWYWDGGRCIELSGCNCRGTDCSHAFPDEAACTAAHQNCNPERCANTGGTWYEAWQYHGCGFHCGYELNVRCDTPFADCRCAPGESFVPGLGCRADTSCVPSDLCLASEGTRSFCPVLCGIPQECPGGQEECNCGPTRNFDPVRGCVADPSCPDSRPEALCNQTGGVWEAAICRPTTCGEHCPLECAADACNCGRFRNFDPRLGCHEDFACRARHVGEDCTPAEGMQCQAGRVCCNGRCAQPCCGDQCDPVTECPR